MDKHFNQMRFIKQISRIALMKAAVTVWSITILVIIATQIYDLNYFFVTGVIKNEIDGVLFGTG